MDCSTVKPYFVKFFVGVVRERDRVGIKLEVLPHPDLQSTTFEKSINSNLTRPQVIRQRFQLARRKQINSLPRLFPLVHTRDRNPKSVSQQNKRVSLRRLSRETKSGRRSRVQHGSPRRECTLSLDHDVGYSTTAADRASNPRAIHPHARAYVRSRLPGLAGARFTR